MKNQSHFEANINQIQHENGFGLISQIEAGLRVWSTPINSDAVFPRIENSACFNFSRAKRKPDEIWCAACGYIARLDDRGRNGRQNSIAIEWHRDWTVHNLTAEICGCKMDRTVLSIFLHETSFTIENTSGAILLLYCEHEIHLFPRSFD